MKNVNREAVRKILDLAHKHEGTGPMSSSAKEALVDAEMLFESYDYSLARSRALASLEYSVGIFHEDHKTANNF